MIRKTMILLAMLAGAPATIAQPVEEPRSGREGVTAATGASGFSRVELEAVRRDLLAWLPGHFDSTPQIDLERRYGAPADGEHEHWYRIFALVDAPHIGEHVIYGQMHVGGPDGPLVRGTQVLYNVRIDERTGTVLANGRRIKDGEKFVNAHLHPELQRKFELDPATGGNCDFRWRPHGRQIHGILNHDGTCRMVSKVSGREMVFDAEWVLNEDELWLFDNNYIVGQGLFMGREDRTHIRLSRVSPFTCDVTVADAAPVGILTHDRGLRRPLPAIGNRDGLLLELLKGQRVFAGPAAEPSTSLAVIGADGAVIAESVQPGHHGAALLTLPGATIACRAAPAAELDRLLTQAAGPGRNH